MNDEKTVDDKMSAFEQRMLDRKPKQDDREAQQQEDLRQSYLKRTGRTELKP